MVKFIDLFVKYQGQIMFIGNMNSTLFRSNFTVFWRINLINLIDFFQLQDCQRDVGETDLLHRGE